MFTAAKKSIFVFCLFISINGNSQKLEELIFSEMQYDSIQLVKNKIRSLHVFSEQIRNYRSGEPKNVATKKIEIEFNPLGQITYQRVSPFQETTKSFHFSETFYRRSKYDHKNRLIFEEELENDNLYSYSCTYNKTGKIINRTVKIGEHYTTIYDYKWENDSLIDLKLIEKNADETDRIPTIKYNQKGGITSFLTKENHFTTDEKIENGIRTKTWRHYRNDTLVTKNQTKIQLDRKLYLELCRTNKDGDTIETLSAKYDSYGNATHLVHKEWRMSSENNEDYRFKQQNKNTYFKKSVFKIDNYYLNGLISKRNIKNTTFIQEMNQKIKPVDNTSIIYRFHYDTEALPTVFFPEPEIKMEQQNRDNSPKEVKVVIDHELPPPTSPSVPLIKE